MRLYLIATLTLAATAAAAPVPKHPNVIQMLAGGPVCAPLLTGKYAGHMSIRSNGRADAPRKDRP